MKKLISNSQSLDQRFQIIIAAISLPNIALYTEKNKKTMQSDTATPTVSSVVATNRTYNTPGVDSELQVQGPRGKGTSLFQQVEPSHYVVDVPPF